VNRQKQDRIRKTAQQYLNSRRLKWSNISFDVYEIMTDLIEDCM
jgi:Holliday junction resolvase-like predicted endonuclease